MLGDGLLGIGVLLSTTLFIVSQAAVDTVAEPSVYEKYGALGLLGVVVTLVLIRVLPAKDKAQTDQSKQFTDCIAEQTKQHREAIKDIIDGYKEELKAAREERSQARSEFKQTIQENAKAVTEMVANCRANWNRE